MGRRTAEPTADHGHTARKGHAYLIRIVRGTDDRSCVAVATSLLLQMWRLCLRTQLQPLLPWHRDWVALLLKQRPATLARKDWAAIRRQGSRTCAAVQHRKVLDPPWKAPAVPAVPPAGEPPFVQLCQLPCV